MSALDNPALGLHDEALGNHLGPQRLLGLLPSPGAAVAGVAHNLQADAVGLLDSLGALAAIGAVGVELLQTGTFAQACATTEASASRSAQARGRSDRPGAAGVAQIGLKRTREFSAFPLAEEGGGESLDRIPAADGCRGAASLGCSFFGIDRCVAFTRSSAACTKKAGQLPGFHG